MTHPLKKDRAFDLEALGLPYESWTNYPDEISNEDMLYAGLLVGNWSVIKDISTKFVESKFSDPSIHLDRVGVYSKISKKQSLAEREAGLAPKEEKTYTNEFDLYVVDNGDRAQSHITDTGTMLMIRPDHNSLIYDYIGKKGIDLKYKNITTLKTSTYSEDPKTIDLESGVLKNVKDLIEEYKGNKVSKVVFDISMTEKVANQKTPHKLYIAADFYKGQYTIFK